MKKKGYFFILDAFIALGILIVGFIIIFGFTVNEPQKGQTVNIADDLLHFLSSKKIQEYNNPYFGSYGILVKNGTIKETEKTLLQQIGEFYHNNDISFAQNLLSNSTSNVIMQQYNYEFYIDDYLIYPPIRTPEFTESKNNADVIFPAKLFSFGTLNDSIEVFGPYNVRVIAWRK